MQTLGGLRLWGRAKVIDDREVIDQLEGVSETERGERAIVFTVLAWDWNCSRYIPNL